MTKPISIRRTLRQAWKLYKEHFWIFVLIAALQLLVSPQDYSGAALTILGILAIILLAFMSTRLALMAVDGKEIDWNRKDFFPTPHEYLKYFLLLIAIGALTLAGLVLLIVPGIYIMIRLYFSVYSYVSSGNASVRDAIRSSWQMVRGSVFWKVFLWAIFAIVMNVLGMAVFGIGLLFTGPMTWLGTAVIFRELQKMHEAEKGEVIVQPAELTEKTEAAPESSAETA